jgi:Fe-S-cluster containining protein
VDNLCSVHPIRPFGCRIFFCDPTATDWQQQQYERFHAELKQLHERFGVAYYYVEWRQGIGTMNQE